MNLLDKVISLVAPYSCLSCGTEGSLLCAGCKPTLGVVMPGRCFGCNKQSSQSKTCKNCRQHSSLAHVWIRSEYKGMPKELIHSLKFQRTPSAATIVGEAMISTLSEITEDTIAVPIPTASSRKRQRGYDQAVLISRSIARQTGMSVVRALVRTGQTRQVGSKKADRLNQLKNAYVVVRPGRISGAHILLIDDVLTTGATLESAAKSLRRAGATQVDALVFARA